MPGIRATAWSVLAGVLVWCALALPASLSELSPAALLRLPVLALVLVAVLLVVRTRAAVVALGVALALVVVLKVVDIGFSAALNRQFHLAYDVANLWRGFDVLADWKGLAWAVGAVAALLVGAAVLVIVLVPAMLRLSDVITRHRRGAVTLLLVGVVGAVLGTQVRGADIVSTATATLVRDHATSVYADYRDASVFAAEIADQPLAGQSRPLGDLAGKDVLIIFVESYGRSSLTDPELAKTVAPVLTTGTSSLAGAGFESRSGWLTSPTFGGESWLAHATLQSGLWVDSGRRYEQLLGAERVTLTRAFGEAGWRTSFVMPSVQGDWPAGQEFYGFDELYGAAELGYRGPPHGWGGIPDQYTLSWLQRSVLSETSTPVMAEVSLVSSHNPWPDPPPLLPWDEIGDGSAYACLPGCAEEGPDDVRSQYAASIAYSLKSVISFVVERPDPDLVVVLVGDHQPWRYVTGEDPSHDVPITLIAADPAVVDQITGWGWTPGMMPDPGAPVWRMDTVQDRFIRAFSAPPEVQQQQ